MAARRPTAAAMNVLTMTTGKRRSVAARVEAPLKPIQPNTRTMVPEDGHGDVVTEDGARFPVLAELADSRTEHHRAGEGREAADGVHHAGAGEVEHAVAQTDVASESCDSQPPPQTQLP